MWKCKNCSEENEDNFDSCWNCGNVKEGNSLQDIQAFQELKKEISEEISMLNESKHNNVYTINRPKSITVIFWVFIINTIISFLFLSLLYFGVGLKSNIKFTFHYMVIFNVIFPLFIAFGLRIGFNWIRILFLALSPISILMAFLNKEVGQLPLILSSLIYIIFLFFLVHPNVVAYFIQSDKTLPKEIKCPHCGEELELSNSERVKRIFVCPECNNKIDMI